MLAYAFCACYVPFLWGGSSMRMASTSVLVAAFVCPAVAIAGQQSPSMPVATFNHYDTSNGPPPAERSFALTLNDGEPFSVVIEQTCEDQFNYTIRGILKAPEPPSSLRIAPAVNPAPKPLADKTIGPTKHEERYGGYIVDVTTKPGAACAIYTEEGDSTPANPQPTNVRRIDPTTFEAHGKRYTAKEVELHDARFF